MAQVKVINKAGQAVKEIELCDAVFGIEPNKQCMFDAIVMQQASLRQGTHDTKGRSEVSGGGKKPFRQKGTGRARQGSTRAPQWRGGGVVFGPTPRSYSYHLNRKVRRLALRSFLSAKVAEECLVVMDSLTFDVPKTKDFVGMMSACGLENTKTLFVVDASENYENAWLSSRNVPNAELLTVEGMNSLSLANATKVVATETAVKRIEEVLA